MCHSPCCSTPDEVLKLMENGYGHRLMLDDLPGGPDLIKPALKGYEGDRSPWQTASWKGCTFWNNGLCELHDTGLKPLHAKLAHHDLTSEENDKISDMIIEAWETEKGKEVIDKWKEANL